MQHIRQEFGEFVKVLFEQLYIVVRGGVVEQLAVVIPYKACTGAAGRHDIVVRVEVFEEFGGNGAAFILVACIESRLSATGLLCIIVHIAAQLLQHLYHIESRFREKLVYEAWYEKLYVHAVSVSDS